MRILHNVTASVDDGRIEEIALTKDDVEAARKLYGPFLKAMLIITHDTPKTGPDPAGLKYLRSEEAIGGGVGFLRKYGFSGDAVKNYEKILKTYVRTKDFDTVENEVEDLAIEMRDKMTNIVRDAAVPHPIISMLKDLITVSRTGSDSAYTRLAKAAGQLHDADLNRIYNTSKVEKSNSARSSLSAIVKGLTGKPGMDIDKATREQLAKKNPTGYKEFLSARRDLIALGKKKLANIVRSSGKHLINADKAALELTRENFIHTIPNGFVGQVDENGALYTSTGKRILGGSGGATEVKMNPAYDPNTDNAYVFSAISPVTGNAMRVYTEEFRKNKNVQKFKKVSDFVNEIEPLRAKWGAQLLKDGSKLQGCALILELAFQTQGRIGNVGNKTDGKNTFGLSTLLCKHATIVSTTKVRLSYTGKSGIHQKHLLVGTDKLSKKAVQLLTESVATGAPNDPLVRFRDRPVNSQAVNIYLKSLGSPVTVHKIRTLKGTLLAKELLLKNPFIGKSPTERQVTDYIKKKMTEVGKILGHMNGDKITPNTAIKSYVDPSVIQEFYDNAGVRPSAAMEKVLQHNREH